LSKVLTSAALAAKYGNRRGASLARSPRCQDSRCLARRYRTPPPPSPCPPPPPTTWPLTHTRRNSLTIAILLSAGDSQLAQPTPESAHPLSIAHGPFWTEFGERRITSLLSPRSSGSPRCSV
jgi:hypothetical protein